jgi:hypothetical protein
MSNKKIDIWISLDHETDGPAAGLHNMLTFGAVAFTTEGNKISTFYRRLTELPDLRSNPDTMIWWRTQNPKAYMEAFDLNLPGVLTESPTQPRTTAYDAMLDLAAWLNRVSTGYKNVRFIPMAWPATFDYAFTNYYCHRFLGANPMGFACLDMRSYIMGLTRSHGYYDLREEDVNKIFGRAEKNPELVDHIAVDDAVKQGELFFYIHNHPEASANLIKKAKDA